MGAQKVCWIHHPTNTPKCSAGNSRNPRHVVFVDSSPREGHRPMDPSVLTIPFIS
jgi:hypothetical protein